MEATVKSANNKKLASIDNPVKWKMLGVLHPVLYFGMIQHRAQSMTSIDFPSLLAAEQVRNELISENLIIDHKLKLEKLDDGEPRGTDKWKEWQRRAVFKKQNNEAKLRQIGLWIKSHGGLGHIDDVAQAAKDAVCKLIDHCRLLREENDELKRDTATTS